MNEEKEISGKEQFEKYLKLRYSPSTIKQYLEAYLRHRDYLLSQKEIDDFLIEKVFSKNHNPFYIGFLKSYIDCFKLPFKITKSKQKGKGLRRKPKFLKKEDIKNIIENSDPYISIMVRLYFETGGRLNEIINTHWNDINLKERTIEGVGKGNKPFILRFSNKTAKLLYIYLERNQREFPFHKKPGLERPDKSFYYYLKKQGKILGIANLHPHRLRHSTGYYLTSVLGWNLEQVRIFLRHSDISTTQIYATATEEEIKRKAEKEFFSEKNKILNRIENEEKEEVLKI